jgi:predicted PP-loop superfamily ATPase
MPVEDPGDIRRRLERLEQIQGELQALLREASLMNARINDSLIDLKDEFKEFREENKKIQLIQLDVASLLTGFAIVKWVAATLGGGGILMVLAFLFKVPVGGP